MHKKIRLDLLLKFLIYSTTDCENMSLLYIGNRQWKFQYHFRKNWLDNGNKVWVFGYVERDVEIKYLCIASCHISGIPGRIPPRQIYECTHPENISRSFHSPFPFLVIHSFLSLSRVGCHPYDAAIVLWTTCNYGGRKSFNQSHTLSVSFGLLYSSTLVLSSIIRKNNK